MQNRAKVLQKMHICKRIEQKVYFWVKVACIWAALSERTFEVGLPQAMSVPSKVHLFVQCEGEAHICPSLRERSFGDYAQYTHYLRTIHALFTDNRRTINAQ